MCEEVEVKQAFLRRSKTYWQLPAASTHQATTRKKVHFKSQTEEVLCCKANLIYTPSMKYSINDNRSLLWLNLGLIGMLLSTAVKLSTWTKLFQGQYYAV